MIVTLYTYYYSCNAIGDTCYHDESINSNCVFQIMYYCGMQRDIAERKWLMFARLSLNHDWGETCDDESWADIEFYDDYRFLSSWGC